MRKVECPKCGEFHALIRMDPWYLAPFRMFFSRFECRQCMKRFIFVKRLLG